jgi:hypothetical protein
MPSLVGNKPNQVPSNGDLGTLAFQDSNAVNISGGTVDVSAGTAALPTLGTTGDPNTGVFFPAADTVAVATNGVERVRVSDTGNVGIGTTSPASSAILDAQSTTKGVRIPNMTTTQKNAISSPVAGLMVFDTTLAKLCVYSGSAWQTITSI